jgi:hypothetical protein
VLQAPDSKTDDVGVKFEEPAKLRPVIVMMPLPDSAMLTASQELTTGAANPRAPMYARLSESGSVEASAQYHRS